MSSETNSATGVSTVTVRTADGVTGTWQYHVQPPGVGASVGAVRLPNNALVDPGWMGVARDVGGLLIVIGVLIGVYVWWRSSHPNPPDKTLRVPGDIVVMSPMKMPGGGHG
ncbi:MAG: hypothetical protein GC157_06080 [Frankiales bacterium]|nr:hypothetical protein [Frankiales bacterium]